MDVYPNSRAQSPACSRAQGAAGELRLHATSRVPLHDILRALILSLLSVLLGRRRQPQAWLYEPAWIEEYALPFPQADSVRPIRIRSIHDGTHLVCEHPILYVIGPGPGKGMRPIARSTPVLRPRHARAPPRTPPHPPHNSIRAKSPPNGGRWRAPVVLP